VKGERIMATETTGRLFPLGQVVATPGALEALEEARVAVGTLVARHAAGDWGNLDPEDRGLNEQALVSGARIFSVYHISDEVTVWVITNGDDEDGTRDATTVLLPAEY